MIFFSLKSNSLLADKDYLLNPEIQINTNELKFKENNLKERNQSHILFVNVSFNFNVEF